MRTGSQLAIVAVFMIGECGTDSKKRRLSGLHLHVNVRLQGLSAGLRSTVSRDFLKIFTSANQFYGSTMTRPYRVLIYERRRTTTMITHHATVQFILACDAALGPILRSQ